MKKAEIEQAVEYVKELTDVYWAQARRLYVLARDEPDFSKAQQMKEEAGGSDMTAERLRHVQAVLRAYLATRSGRRRKPKS